MTLAISTVEVEELLLVLKIAFLVLLYLFIWRIVRSGQQGLRLPQESFILDPEQAAALRRARPSSQTGELVVVRSPTLAEGEARRLELARRSRSAAAADERRRARRGDDFASARHARFEPRRDGVWLEDVGSTNGTFVNGVQRRRARGG